MPRFVSLSVQFLLLTVLAGLPAPAMSQGCSGNALIEATFAAGSRWDMCWELRDEEGVVLKDVHYQASANSPRRSVLKQANLAEIYVNFDDGSIPAFNVTDIAAGAGLGVAANMHALEASDCPSGSLHTAGSVAVVCEQVLPRGYAYKYYSTVQKGEALVVHHRTTIGLNTYVVRWRFFDDGSVEPAVGLTGEVPAISSIDKYGWALDDNHRIGVGFNTSYYWRLDFDIGPNASDDIVEQIEILPTDDRTKKTLSQSNLTNEASVSVNADVKRSWRVRDASITNSDGHFISYHLEPLHVAHRFEGTADTPWATHDLHVTRFESCERFVRANPTTGGCGSDISDFVNSQGILPGNVVLWYRLNYHHLPRSEDEPALPVHWQSFIIVPRDWTSENLIGGLSTTQPPFHVHDSDLWFSHG